MPNWTINKWAGGIAPDEYYGAEGTFKHVSGLRCGQDLRYVTPANATGTALQSFTTGGTHIVTGIYQLDDMGVANTNLYSTSRSGNFYLWKDSTNVYLQSTSAYNFLNFAPQSISGTMNMVYQTYTGSVYKNSLSDINTSSWTLGSVGTIANSSGFGAYNVSLDGAALLMAQGNAIHSVSAAGTLTRHFYIGDSTGAAGSFGFVGLTKFADQVKAYMSYKSPKIFFFQASELAGQAVGAVADSSKPSYSIDLPNVTIYSVTNDGPIDYIIGAEHGYPVILAVSGYSVSRVYSGKTRGHSTTLSGSTYSGTRGLPVQWYNNRVKDTSIVSGKRLYATATDEGSQDANLKGRVAVYGGMSNDKIDYGFSLRNSTSVSGERFTTFAYNTGNSFQSALLAGTSQGNVYSIPCESSTSSAASSYGYLITRDFDAGLYSAKKYIEEINIGCEIKNGSSLEFAISTDSSNQPTYKIVKTFAYTDVLNGRVRVVPQMLIDATGGLGEFNKCSYRIKLTNGASTEVRVYDVDTRWKFVKQ